MPIVGGLRKHGWRVQSRRGWLRRKVELINWQVLSGYHLVVSRVDDRHHIARLFETRRDSWRIGLVNRPVQMPRQDESSSLLRRFGRGVRVLMAQPAVEVVPQVGLWPRHRAPLCSHGAPLLPHALVRLA